MLIKPLGRSSLCMGIKYKRSVVIFSEHATIALTFSNHVCRSNVCISSHHSNIQSSSRE